MPMYGGDISRVTCVPNGLGAADCGRLSTLGEIDEEPRGSFEEKA
jgi:hypothetical protein